MDYLARAATSGRKYTGALRSRSGARAIFSSVWVMCCLSRALVQAGRQAIQDREHEQNAVGIFGLTQG